MCDYSLHDVVTRPAKVGDKLTSTSFNRSISRSFCAVGEPNLAVCLVPGTELMLALNPCPVASQVGNPVLIPRSPVVRRVPKLAEFNSRLRPWANRPKDLIPSAVRARMFRISTATSRRLATASAVYRPY